MWRSALGDQIPPDILGNFEKMRLAIKPGERINSRFRTFESNQNLFDCVLFVAYDRESGYGIGICMGPNRNVYFARYDAVR